MALVIKCQTKLNNSCFYASVDSQVQWASLSLSLSLSLSHTQPKMLFLEPENKSRFVRTKRHFKNFKFILNWDRQNNLKKKIKLELNVMFVKFACEQYRILVYCPENIVPNLLHLVPPPPPANKLIIEISTDWSLEDVIGKNVFFIKWNGQIK